MANLNRSDLKFQYSDVAVPGDDPRKTKEDATRFSRHESYEMLQLINGLKFIDVDRTSTRDTQLRLKMEWVIRQKLPVTIQGRDKVKQWAIENFGTLSKLCPY